MNLLIIAVKDRSAGFYFPPFFVRSQVEAIRAFTSIMNQKERSGAASEYELAHFGDFDDGSGVFALETPPRVLANGADVVSGVPG